MALVKYNNNSISAVTAASGLTAGAMTLIKSQTADASSGTVAFVNGSSDVVLDSTYKEYLFTFKNMHPSANGGYFQVNFRDGGSSYDATKTTTMFSARHDEDDGNASIAYKDSNDLAQGTGVQFMDGFGVNNDNDSCISGTLQLYNPSSTTFVKHFLATSVAHAPSSHNFIAGYCNVTAAIDGVQFSFQSGNIDAGDICLYGIL